MSNSKDNDITIKFSAGSIEVDLFKRKREESENHSEKIEDLENQRKVTKVMQRTPPNKSTENKKVSVSETEYNMEKLEQLMEKMALQINDIKEEVKSTRMDIRVTKSELQSKTRQIFSCDHRPAGYYADLETGCQVYHMCDGLGRQFSYTCPNNTLFQQRMLICDHWYMVNCNKSEIDYTANLLIGQRNKPFVEDKHPYHRTPRPDILNGSDYNYIFKDKNSEFASNYNLVGIETDDSEESSSSSNVQTRYSLPSHWFTALYDEITTQISDIHRKNHHKENIIEKKSSIKDTKNTIKRQESNGILLQKSFNTNEKIKNYAEERSNDDIDAILPETNNQTTVTDTDVTSNYQKKTTNNNEQWEILRKMFFIPDYQFPLDSATRPGYDSGKSSFDTSSLS
ncbi:hypothetical protein RN001_005135 [Aquatica leii]|uniref:Chitin-binding type-2 domain-containing protein n=1 Tax=Aquatica leii TaxID=1421715 RepID=A0AAN7PFL8_9COLE|nr:hypothetical protein RN001_005135 [Aquatica leii]